MIKIKNLGICMDHASARLIEFSLEPAEALTIDSAFTQQEKEEGDRKSESITHNKEQHEQHTYYKELGEKIRNYEKVLLFGPTEAKQELYNLLKADHHFDKIKIEVKHTDKMNAHEQKQFVQDYFSRH